MAQPRASTDMPLDRNESYWLLDRELLDACKDFDVRVLSTYPDYGILKGKIAAYAGVHPSEVCLTPGSDAAIEVLARMVAAEGKKALLPVPTFYGYESILTRARAEIVPIYYTEEDGRFAFPINAFAREMQSDDIGAAFICSPNNPLGNCMSDEERGSVLQSMRDSSAYLVSDEAYFEYSGFTLLPERTSMPKLVLIRTLSKGFGIPGARVGYCIAAPELIMQMEKELLPWPVAHASAFVAETLLDAEPRVRERRDAVIHARGSFIKALRDLEDMSVYDSDTNFVLMRVPDADKAVAHLLEQGICVAKGESMSRYPEAKELLRSTVRIAIPSPEDMPKLIDALRDFTK